VKAYIATGSGEVIYSNTNALALVDKVEAGSLYVIDEQALHTSRFTVAPQTLTAGEHTIGNILLPHPSKYSQPAANYFYVVSAVANGTSATDKWLLNGTTLLTTATTSGSLKVAAIGEGFEYNQQSAYTVENPATAGFSVLPIVLKVAAETTTTVPMELEVVWCLTPLTA
jgi:hypothetical protein